MIKFMKKNIGIAFVDVLIILMVVGILTIVAVFPIMSGKHETVDRTKCVAGYKFYHDRQILDKDGNGLKCEEQPTVVIPPATK